MVKLIGDGKKSEIECGNCCGLLQYTNDDISTEHGIDISGGADGRKFIIWPRCSFKVITRAW